MIENQYTLLGFCFLDIFEGDHSGGLEYWKDSKMHYKVLIYLCFNDKAQLKLIPWNQNV